MPWILRGATDISNPRFQIKLDLLADPQRVVTIEGEFYHCEGKLFKPHQCYTALHMNEVLFTRDHIRHLSKKEKEYFWHPINCSINCSWFHELYGHTKLWREFYIVRVAMIYGKEVVLDYIEKADSKVKPIHLIYKLNELE